jgi:uncharacterized cupredoxin-like copper-binding protein
MSRSRRIMAVGVALIAPLLLLAYTATAAAAPVAVHIAIHFSSYGPAHVSVPRGRPVTFFIDNTDPIDHEWIVGTDAVHAAHRTGTEAHHGDRPTELSIPALETRSTTITFDQAGTLRFICHLPGHEAYGMTGVVDVH